MRLEDFDFELPEEQIAQTPAARRDSARLLVARRSGGLAHRVFSDFPDLLRPSDLVVVNDVQVIRARLLGSKFGTGGRAELLLIQPDAPVATADALEAPL